MNIYFRSFFASASFFLTHSLYAMDQQQALVPMNPGIFDRLDKHKKARDVLFASLEPNALNGLRKTCKRFSESFSFCNPSTEFILCKNMNIHKKDMQRIFFTAVYDGNHEIASILADNDKIGPRYKIPGTSHALYPYLIAQANKDEKMCSLLKHLEGAELEAAEHEDRFNPCDANPLLIACVSRNNERVRKALTDPKVILDQLMVQLALNATIDGNDTQSLAVMLNDEMIRNYIKENGVVLISEAIFGGNKKSCQVLLAANLCDLNTRQGQTPVAIRGFSNEQSQLIEALYSLQSFTLLDGFLGDEDLYKEIFGDDFFEEIKEMLIKNGAKTSKELENEKTI